MEYFLIIVVLILLVGGKSAKSIKAFRQELSDLENSTETPQPAFESLFKTAKPEKKSFADEERSAGYFTYESMDAPARPAQSQNSQKMLVAEVQEPQVEFNLRQAVILDTILRAKYVPDSCVYDN